MKLTDWERLLLNYYINNYKAKWVRVFNNKHPLFDTQVCLYTIYKRKLKNQPTIGQLTYTNMFKQLVEGKWYYIPDLLNLNKEEE